MEGDSDDDHDKTMVYHHHDNPQLGPSLLPQAVAGAISVVTNTTSIYLRIGTFIGGLAIDGARVTTLTGLEAGRAVVGSLLRRASRDVTNRSITSYERDETESLLERAINTLHSTITYVSFAASTGFQISSTALSSAGDLSQQILGALDALLGSTDSSRAIASIVTLIRREFANPATGLPGEKVGLTDLLVGICGLAVLQRWSRRLSDADDTQRRVDEVIWDVIVLDNGRRADVVGESDSHRTGCNFDTIPPREGLLGASFANFSSGEGVALSAEHARSLELGDIENDLSEMALRKAIMENLPSDSNATIKTEISTVRTVTVEVSGTHLPFWKLPPGVEVIEETPLSNGLASTEIASPRRDASHSAKSPRHHVVYRIISNTLRKTQIAPAEIVNSGPETHSFVMKHVDPIEHVAVTNREIMDNTARNRELSRDLEPTRSIELVAAQSIANVEVASSCAEDKSFDTASRSSTTEGPSRSSVATTTANQKRTRRPVMTANAGASDPARFDPQSRRPRPSPQKKIKSSDSVEGGKRKGGIREALRKGSGTALSTLWHKDAASDDPPATAAFLSIKHPRNSILTSTSSMKPRDKSIVKPKSSHTEQCSQSKNLSSSSMVDPKSCINGLQLASGDNPRSPQLGNPNYFSSCDLGRIDAQSPDPFRSPSRTSYHVTEQRRDSVISSTDTYSIQSIETRPNSPTTLREQLGSHVMLARSQSEKDVSSDTLLSNSSNNIHRRSRSYVGSVYTMKNNSELALSLQRQQHRSVYDREESLNSLARTGIVDGMFPNHHLVRNISRFIKFASASYGSSFLRVMGITEQHGSHKLSMDENHHYEHHSFSHHTQLPASSILLSSFVDPQGGTDSTGNTNTGVPMVHFVSLDHESRAVVLTCRGTLGFEDVLTDMTCDYDDLHVRGIAYKVHKGIHASALRLLSGAGSRVMSVLRTALEEFPEYGLVLCGHSLGGAVVALLAIMISEPASPPACSFLTSFSPYTSTVPRRLTYLVDDEGTAPTPNVYLPSGRPIHVYAYGPPATLSPSLRHATRGLITTIINSQDTIPYLSLGVLHDLQAIALAFKTDTSGAKGEVRSRVWAGLIGSFTDRWYNRSTDGLRDADEDDEWAYAALKALRASMLSKKLVPPGECFIVETMPVLQRDTFSRDDAVGVGQVAAGNAAEDRSGLGRPATRVVLRYVRDAERRFGELRFGGSMLLDHSPGRYEKSLKALRSGVLE